MPVSFKNYEYSFLNQKRKPVFVPSDKGREIGYDLKDRIERRVAFEDFYYHLKPGGHVSALHAHRGNSYFSKVDIDNFFYRVGRNRLARALHEEGIARAAHYAKWSCVRNPFSDPRYAVPYGFVQSPIVTTLVLRNSPVGTYLKKISSSITVSVFMDDIAISSKEKDHLEMAFIEIQRAFDEANLPLKVSKSCPPSDNIDIFNCYLEEMKSVVTQERKDLFYSQPRSGLSAAAFDDYCLSVEEGNTAPASSCP